MLNSSWQQNFNAQVLDLNRSLRMELRTVDLQVRDDSCNSTTKGSQNVEESEPPRKKTLKGHHSEKKKKKKCTKTDEGRDRKAVIMFNSHREVGLEDISKGHLVQTHACGRL